MGQRVDEVLVGKLYTFTLARAHQVKVDGFTGNYRAETTVGHNHHIIADFRKQQAVLGGVLGPWRLASWWWCALGLGASWCLLRLLWWHWAAAGAWLWAGVAVALLRVGPGGRWLNPLAHGRVVAGLRLLWWVRRTTLLRVIWVLLRLLWLHAYSLQLLYGD